jgi:hypothetical protein
MYHLEGHDDTDNLCLILSAERIEIAVNSRKPIAFGSGGLGGVPNDSWTASLLDRVSALEAKVA